TFPVLTYPPLDRAPHRYAWPQPFYATNRLIEIFAATFFSGRPTVGAERRSSNAPCVSTDSRDLSPVAEQWAGGAYSAFVHAGRSSDLIRLAQSELRLGVRNTLSAGSLA